MSQCKNCGFGTENGTGICDKCEKRHQEEPKKPRDDKEIVIRQIFSYKGDNWLFEVGWDIEEGNGKPKLVLQRPIRLNKR